jgi:catechol 2,3-dioxygenase-like lactoylglutathione lyase family enzyme
MVPGNHLGTEWRMGGVRGFDHVAITVADMEATCRWYAALFGARPVNDFMDGGRVLVRQIAFGGALLSVHPSGNGLDLVARRPTVGAADICFRWEGTIESAVVLLREHGVDIVEGPTPRRTADGLPSQSVYFRDPDGNLLELMAADPG